MDLPSRPRPRQVRIQMEPMKVGLEALFEELRRIRMRPWFKKTLRIRMDSGWF